jgi:GDP-mannose 6-dehydrogenase
MVRVSILGLGYLGTVPAGCLAHDGHEVVGVDCIQTKFDLINKGQSFIIEAGSEIVASSTQAGRGGRR